MAKSITIDSRKFLATINESAQAKVAMFGKLVEDIGKRSNRNWKLAALNGDKLYIEDAATKQYYIADQKRHAGGKITIENIKPIQIVEEKKQSLYDQNVLKLVDAVEENDQKGMRQAWNSINAHRFSSRTIPESGIVKTRDGEIRQINVVNDGILNNSVKDRLVAALVESVTDQVIVEDGEIVGASFHTDPEKRIPVSEWTCCRVVGNNMREVASKAYLSTGFQNRIYKVAQLIEQDKVRDGISILENLLVEKQEFCTLNRDEINTLVENTLATKAVFNQDLCRDTATLFYRTNLKFNRDTIIKEWRATAQRAQHPTLLENVNKLEKSKDFEASYDTFIKMIFSESASPRDDEIMSYRKALEMLRNSKSIKEDVELRTKLDELIMRLNESDVDDATVNVVREALAAARKEVDALKRLGDFDNIPGDTVSEDMDDDLSGGLGDIESEGGGGQPTININAPLIQIGGTSSGGGEDDLGDDDGLGDLGGGEEEGGENDGLGGLGGEEEGGGDDLGGLEDLGGGGDEEEGLGGGGGLGLESKNTKKALTESEQAVRKVLGLKSDSKIGPDISNLIHTLASKADELNPTGRQLRRKLAESEEGKDGKPKWEKPWLKKDKDGKKDDEGSDEGESDEGEESDDQYAFGEDVSLVSGLGSSYGIPALGDELVDVVESMLSIVDERGITEEVALKPKNLEILANEAFKRLGLKLPTHKLNEAVYQATTEFKQKLTESQYKWSTRAIKKGDATKARKRSTIAKDDKKKSGGATGENNLPESIQHVRIIEEDAEKFGVLYETDGTQFILDYADPPIITSTDRQVTIPVPAELHNSAFAAARIAEGNSAPFFGWVAQHLVQLQNINEDEDRELNEAVATIRTGPDGSIDVSVDSQDPQVQVTDVNEVDPEMDMDGGMGDEVEDMEMGGDPEIGDPEMGDDEEGMTPVTDMGDGVVDEPEGQMPDFEGGEEIADVGPEAGAEPEMDDDEAMEGEEKVVETREDMMVGEDHDITDPEKGDYNTAKQELRDQSKEAGKATKKGNGNKLDGWDGKMKTDDGKGETELKKAKPGKNRQD